MKKRLLKKRIESLEAQLPLGMGDCTILYRECNKGHGWLTATSWVEVSCPTCARESLEAELSKVKADLLIMQGVLPMTDPQRDAFIAAVIEIAEKLK